MYSFTREHVTSRRVYVVYAQLYAPLSAVARGTRAISYRAYRIIVVVVAVVAVVVAWTPFMSPE